MKLSPRDAVAYLAKPDQNRAGMLIYGADPMRVALKRQQLIAALIGPNGDEEMRLTRLSGPDLRKDPALLNDAIKAVSFFPGPRVAFVEEASDNVADPIAAALTDWRDGDAQIVVTAGTLRAGSPLRKRFEAHDNAYCLAIYDDPPSRAEIEAELARAGLGAPDRDAMEAIVAISRRHDPGEFRQTLEKLALYKLDDETPLAPADVIACAPATSEAATDDAVAAVADARHRDVGPLIVRLQSQGIQPVALCIAAARHFRALHAAASDPAGPSSGVAKLRPPVFGPRRERMIKQAQNWGAERLERAIGMLIETDLTLRSSQQMPQMALLERCFIRLAMLGKR